MSLKLLKKQAEQALRSIEVGKEYSSKYVVNRLDSAWDKHPKDQVIANVRSVLVKMASRKDSFNQNEITDLYNKFYNIAGGSTSFRDELGDLLRDGFGKSAEPVKGELAKFAADTAKPVSISEKSALSDAFSVLFSFGSNDDSGTYNKNLVKKAERLVSLELNSLGIKPDMVKMATGNDHFILCNAYYKNPDFTTTHVSIPVQVSNGSVSIPSQIISNGELQSLSKENILVSLKSSQKQIKETANQKYSGLRKQDSVNIPSAKLPSALKEKLDISEEVILASSRYSPEQIRLATSVVATEVSSWGTRPQVKFAGTTDRGMTMMVKTATSKGEKSFVVPVEISNSKVIMPSEFAAGSVKYSFSSEGFNSFLGDSKPVNSGFTFSRDMDELQKLSYSELMNVVIDGVSRGDYKASEDALSTVSAKYGPEKFKTALEDFQKILKVSKRSENEDLIRAALQRGDLIRTRNSVELFSPKLGLPLSKLAFDEKGRVVPKFRTEKRELDSIDGTIISTSKIVMS